MKRLWEMSPGKNIYDKTAGGLPSISSSRAASAVMLSGSPNAGLMQEGRGVLVYFLA